MDGDQDTRPTLIAQPTPADSSELAGSARQREDKLFSGFESLDWRDNELLGLDVLDVDEEDDEAGAERRRPGSNQLSDDMTAATKASTAATEAPESLEVGESSSFAWSDCRSPFSLHSFQRTFCKRSTNTHPAILRRDYPERRHLPNLLWASRTRNATISPMQVLRYHTACPPRLVRSIQR